MEDVRSGRPGVDSSVGWRVASGEDGGWSTRWFVLAFSSSFPESGTG